MRRGLSCSASHTAPMAAAEQSMRRYDPCGCRAGHRFPAGRLRRSRHVRSTSGRMFVEEQEIPPLHEHRLALPLRVHRSLLRDRPPCERARLHPVHDKCGPTPVASSEHRSTPKLREGDRAALDELMPLGLWDCAESRGRSCGARRRSHAPAHGAGQRGVHQAVRSMRALSTARASALMSLVMRQYCDHARAPRGQARRRGTPVPGQQHRGHGGARRPAMKVLDLHTRWRSGAKIAGAGRGDALFRRHDR
jgi:hypothetical protein